MTTTRRSACAGVEYAAIDRWTSGACRRPGVFVSHACDETFDFARVGPLLRPGRNSHPYLNLIRRNAVRPHCAQVPSRSRFRRASFAATHRLGIGAISTVPGPWLFWEEPLKFIALIVARRQKSHGQPPGDRRIARTEPCFVVVGFGGQRVRALQSVRFSVCRAAPDNSSQVVRGLGDDAASPPT